ncbi:hypothetical protein LLB_1564 [Legionella longbeachae D-4968]|nr:hypothetical protein LLB_1564 [Legionella longbeachae D-4968]
MRPRYNLKINNYLMLLNPILYAFIKIPIVKNGFERKLL